MNVLHPVARTRLPRVVLLPPTGPASSRTRAGRSAPTSRPSTTRGRRRGRRERSPRIARPQTQRRGTGCDGCCRSACSRAPFHRRPLGSLRSSFAAPPAHAPCARERHHRTAAPRTPRTPVPLQPASVRVSHPGTAGSRRRRRSSHRRTTRADGARGTARRPGSAMPAGETSGIGRPSSRCTTRPDAGTVPCTRGWCPIERVRRERPAVALQRARRRPAPVPPPAGSASSVRPAPTDHGGQREREQPQV